MGIIDWEIPAFVPKNRDAALHLYSLYLLTKFKSKQR